MIRIPREDGPVWLSILVEHVAIISPFLVAGFRCKVCRIAGRSPVCTLPEKMMAGPGKGKDFLFIYVSFTFSPLTLVDELQGFTGEQKSSSDMTLETKQE